MTDEKANATAGPAETETDPQDAIDAESARERDPRIHDRTAGQVQEGVPFIGAGPGDPGLLTVTGKELVEAADLVIHAGSLVNSELLETYCDDAETVSSIGKDLEELIPLMRDAHEDGRDVVRLHSGDPATFAAAEPESAAGPSDADAVHAVGIGPGNREYLTPRGERAIREADVVVGFETVVEFVEDVATGEVLACGYRDEAETLATVAERVADGATGTAVLMGDPNHSGYQFVGKVQRAVDRPVRVVPGISSLQVAASRARTPMEDAEFVTLHRSGDLAPDRERLREHVGDRHLLVLPRPYDLMPGDVAADLLDAGADESLSALVLERLTHDDESMTRTTLGELAGHAGGSDPDDSPFSDLSVLVVRAG